MTTVGRRGRYLSLGILLTLGIAVAFAIAEAQPPTRELLHDLDIETVDGDTWLRVRFTLPVVYLTHAPLKRGSSLAIQIQPLAAAAGGTVKLARRESLPIPADAVPLTGIEYDGTLPGDPFLILSFDREVRFRIEPGLDPRSLSIVIPAP